MQLYSTRKAEFLDRRNARLSQELGLPRNRDPPNEFNGQVVRQPYNHPIVGPIWRTVQCITKHGLQVPTASDMAYLFSSGSTQDIDHSSGGASYGYDLFDSESKFATLSRPLSGRTVMCTTKTVAKVDAEDDAADGEDASGHERTFVEVTSAADDQNAQTRRMEALEKSQSQVVDKITSLARVLNQGVVNPVGTGGGGNPFAVNQLDFTTSVNGMNILEACRKGKLVEWLNALYQKQNPIGSANPIVSAPVDASPTEHAALGLIRQLQDERRWKIKLKQLNHPLNALVLYVTRFILRRSWAEVILGLALIIHILPAHLSSLRTTVLRYLLKLVTRIAPRLPMLILLSLSKLGGAISMIGAGIAASCLRASRSTAVARISSGENVVATVGRISDKDKIIAATALMPTGAILGDNGATIDCSATGLGRLPGTFNAGEAGSLSVGDAEASLRSEGTWLHAVKLTGVNGVCENRILRMHDTPNGIADIISEALEHNERNSSVIWKAGEPRRYHTAGDAVLELAMAPNGLGWLKIEPIGDRSTIKSLLSAYYLKMSTSAGSQVDVEVDQTGLNESDTKTPLPLPWISVNTVMDPTRTTMAGCSLLRSNLTVCCYPVIAVSASTSLTSTGFGRPPKLTGLEILTRTHVLLGHASLGNVLRTLQGATGLRNGAVTKADIEEYVRRGCGICESIKMRRRPFPAPSDKTPPPVGKRWVFDSLTLRTKSALGNKYLTRFVNVVENGDGKRRTYGHKELTAEDLESVVQKHRAFVRPHHGEILILKHDGHPSLRSRDFTDFLNDCSILDQLTVP